MLELHLLQNEQQPDRQYPKFVARHLESQFQKMVDHDFLFSEFGDTLVSLLSFVHCLQTQKLLPSLSGLDGSMLMNHTENAIDSLFVLLEVAIDERVFYYFLGVLLRLGATHFQHFIEQILLKFVVLYAGEYITFGFFVQRSMWFHKVSIYKRDLDPTCEVLDGQNRKEYHRRISLAVHRDAVFRFGLLVCAFSQAPLGLLICLQFFVFYEF